MKFFLIGFLAINPLYSSGFDFRAIIDKNVRINDLEFDDLKNIIRNLDILNNNINELYKGKNSEIYHHKTSKMIFVNKSIFKKLHNSSKRFYLNNINKFNNLMHTNIIILEDFNNKHLTNEEKATNLEFLNEMHKELMYNLIYKFNKIK